MRTFFQSTLFLALLSSCITLTSASGGAPQAPKAESTMDTSKPLHQNIIEQALNQTTNAKAYNPEGVIDNSQESALMAKIGSLTDAHGPTYNQDNPFPRPFWPQNVKFQGKMWAGVMFSLWLCILGTYRAVSRTYHENDRKLSNNYLNCRKWIIWQKKRPKLNYFWQFHWIFVQNRN